MPSVAEQLRLAREKKNLTVYDVAEATKIRTDHVRALEEGKYEMFPAPVYIRGFVRTYATLVRLDVAAVLRDLEGELGATKQFGQPPGLTPSRPGAMDYVMLQISRLNWQWVGLIAAGGLVLALALVGYRMWDHYRTADPLASLSSGVYEPPATNVGEVLPLPVSRPD